MTARAILLCSMWSRLSAPERSQEICFVHHSTPLPRTARHLCPRQSRGPGGAKKMARRIGPRTLGGLRLIGEATAATARPTASEKSLRQKK